MKANVMFRDQVNQMVEWFDKWNECEQTVALCSLFKKLGPLQARFFVRVLENLHTDSMDLPMMERQANNVAFLNSLHNQSTEQAIIILLRYLPLLNPGDSETKEHYLSLIQRVLASTVHTGEHLSEARQLLSYAHVHPALNADDRARLNSFMKRLEELQQTIQSGQFGQQQQQYHQQSSQNGGGGANTYAARVASTPWRGSGNLVTPPKDYRRVGVGTPPSLLQPVNVLKTFPSMLNGGGTSVQQQMQDGRIQRSNSLTPPTSPAASSSNNSLYHHHHSPTSPTADWKPRSMSLSLGSAPVSPESSGVSSASGSEVQLALYSPSSSSFGNGTTTANRGVGGSIAVDRRGMQNVAFWLKNLRLHKYSQLFSAITYDEMMSLTADKLEAMEVTKGARKKILQHLQKLRDRQKYLHNLEKQLLDGGSLRNALYDMKDIMDTPMKAFEGGPPPPPNDDSSSSSSSSIVQEGDTPGQFMRTLRQIYSQLITMDPKLNDDSCSHFHIVVERGMEHEAFTTVQKTKMREWRNQIRNRYGWMVARRGSDLSHNREHTLGYYGGNNNNNNNNYYSSHFRSSSKRRTSFGPIGGGMMPLMIRRRSNPVICSPSNGSFDRHFFHQPPKHHHHHHHHSYHNNLYEQQQQQRRRSSLTMNTDVSRAPPPSFELNPSPRSVFLDKRQSLPESYAGHAALSRAKSLPVPPGQYSLFGKSPGNRTSACDAEVISRLEDLSVSVTEHALGSCG